MRNAWCICLSLLMLGAVCSGAGQGSAAPPDELLGLWTGSWEGGGAGGGFDLTLEKGKDGKPGGGVSVTGEPTYKATPEDPLVGRQEAGSHLRLPAGRAARGHPRGDV